MRPDGATDVEDVDRGDNRGLLRGDGPGLYRDENLPAPCQTPPHTHISFSSPYN